MSAHLFRRELCWAGLVARDADDVLQRLARALAQQGFARPSLEAAVQQREAASPTGLPLAGRKVAIPHADPEHVLAPAVAVCSLARPVCFHELGNPAGTLDVELVAMLALPDAQAAQDQLVRLMERFQDPASVDQLCLAADADALFALLADEPQETP